MLPICSITLLKYKFYQSYCNGNLKMVAKTTGTCSRLIIYVKQYFTGVHFLVQYISKGNGTGKVHPRTGNEVPKRGKRYSSTLSLPSALDGVGRQRDAPSALSQYPLYRKMGGPTAVLDECGKSRPHWHSIPGPSIP